MPIGITARGGANYMAGIDGLNQQQAQDILARVQTHINLPGKSSGTFVLVNRTKDGAQIELQRKSGFQLFGRGRSNTRLNDTMAFWDKVLRQAGLPEAAEKLQSHLATRATARHRNRVDVPYIQTLLKEYMPDAAATDQIARQEAPASEPIKAKPAVRPPLAEGRSIQELLRNARIVEGNVIGTGAFGVVKEIQLGDDPAPRVFKVFTEDEPQILSLQRSAAPNEAMAAYLVSDHHKDYASTAQVAETQYFAVSVQGRYQLVDSQALRDLIKHSPKDSVLSHGLIMAKIDGGEAFDFIEKLAPHERKTLYRQTLTSLKILNQRGFVVRDHKLENVMWSPATQKATLIDTGLFYKVSKNKPETRFIHGVAGSPKYMHMRALSGAPHGTETDVYAQGMLTLSLEYPYAMYYFDRFALKQITKFALDSGDRGEPITKGFNANDFIVSVDESLTIATRRRDTSAIKALTELRHAMNDPNSPASFAMQCMDLSSKPADEWADRPKAQLMFDELLNHPAMN